MVAIDPDEGVNGTVEYSILSTTTEWTRRFFSIQQTTGIITTRQSLNSAAGYHSLLVVAFDKGQPSLRTTGLFKTLIIYYKYECIHFFE